MPHPRKECTPLNYQQIALGIIISLVQVSKGSCCCSGHKAGPSLSWPNVFIVVAIKGTCKWHLQWHLSPHSEPPPPHTACMYMHISLKDNALRVWLMLTWWWLSCTSPRMPHVCVELWAELWACLLWMNYLWKKCGPKGSEPISAKVPNHGERDSIRKENTEPSQMKYT